MDWRSKYVRGELQQRYLFTRTHLKDSNSEKKTIFQNRQIEEIEALKKKNREAEEKLEAIEEEKRALAGRLEKQSRELSRAQREKVEAEEKRLEEKNVDKETKDREMKIFMESLEVEKEKEERAWTINGN